jgi:hypothetical protein
MISHHARNDPVTDELLKCRCGISADGNWRGRRPLRSR